MSAATATAAAAVAAAFALPTAPKSNEKAV